MQQSRRELLDDFLDYVNAAGDVAARNLAERLLNRVIELIWMKRAWRQFVMPDLYQFSTIASTRAYVLPSYFGRVSSRTQAIRNATTGADLLPVDIDDLRERVPIQGSSLEVPGCPRQYAIAGTMPVQVQPASTGDALEVLSDNAADATVEVYLEGLDATGLEVTKQVTLTGTNPVACGTWSKLTAFGKSYPNGTVPTTELTSSEGTVTLRKVAGAVPLETLAPDQSARDHASLVLYPLPDQVYTITVPVLRAPRRLIRDADPLPAFWGSAVFDKMVLAWRVGDRDIPVDNSDTWPTLTDLVCYDNAQTAPMRRHRTPFGG